MEQLMTYKPEEICVTEIAEFAHLKHLDAIVDKYFYQLTTFGTIAASVYAMNYVNEDEKEEFMRRVENEAKKYGF